MNKAEMVTNVVIAGLGGQGVISAANVLADAAVRTGYDVKQSEIHGMSQRGGSVTSDVRFGPKVYSPMVPVGEADFVLVLHPSQQDNNRYHLKHGGCFLSIVQLLDGKEDLSVLDGNDTTPITSRNSNIAMLGILSRRLQLPVENWESAIRAILPPNVHDQNIQAFHFGRTQEE